MIKIGYLKLIHYLGNKFPTILNIKITIKYKNQQKSTNRHHPVVISSKTALLPKPVSLVSAYYIIHKKFGILGQPIFLLLFLT